MNKLYIMKAFLIGLMLLSMNASFADKTTQKSTDHRNIYDKGMTAYKNEDYVTALKYLFSYRLINEGKLVEHKEFSSQLNAAIEHSEKELRETIKLAGKNENKEKESRFRALGF